MVGYGKFQNALCLTDLKAAALYFDRVIPINPVELIDYDLPPITDTYDVSDYHTDLIAAVRNAFKEHSAVARNLVFKGVEVSDTFVEKAFDEIATRTLLLQQSLRQDVPQAFYNAQYIMPLYHTVQQILTSELLAKNSQLESGFRASDLMLSMCKLLGVDEPAVLLANVQEQFPIQSDGAVELVLSEVQMVDTQRLSFDHILEVRADHEAQTRLKRLRLYLHESFADVPTAVAKDKFDLMMDDYEKACKKHGLDTIETGLSALFSLEGLTVAAIGLGTGSVAGGAGIASLATGAAFALGNAALKLVQSRRVAKSYAANHPVSYIFQDIRTNFPRDGFNRL